MSIGCAEAAEPCVDELSHLVDFENVLLAELGTHLFVLSLFHQKGYFSSLQSLEESALEPRFQGEFCQLGGRNRTEILCPIDFAEHVVLDDLPCSYFVGWGHFANISFVDQMVAEEVVSLIDLKFHFASQASGVLTFAIFFQIFYVSNGSAAIGAWLAAADAASITRSTSHFLQI